MIETLSNWIFVGHVGSCSTGAVNIVTEHNSKLSPEMRRDLVFVIDVQSIIQQPWTELLLTLSRIIHRKLTAWLLIGPSRGNLSYSYILTLIKLPDTHNSKFVRLLKTPRGIRTDALVGSVKNLLSIDLLQLS